MLLQSYKVHDVLADFDPVTGAFLQFSRGAEPARAAGQEAGDFDYIDGKRVLVFRFDGNLYMQVDDQRMRLDEISVELRCPNGRRILCVLSRGKAVLELTCDPPVLDPPLSDDPTPFVEEQDFDFGLFLANLSRDRSRQSRIYGGC